MVELSEIEYSQDECVAAVRDYYSFLTKMYLPESLVLEPPESGWPEITKAVMKDLDKTDVVISLLQHLPYIRGDGYEGAPWTTFANWASSVKNVSEGADDMEGLRICSEGNEDLENINAHVIGLTMGGRDNPVFLLDTELGIILWPECPRQISSQGAAELVEDDPFDYAAENEAEWRSGCASWAISDFFELLKDQFRKLHYVPMSAKTVKDVYATLGPDKDGMLVMLQGIYPEHGWPDLEAYRKRQCLQAVQAALKERYPGTEEIDEGALASLED